MIIKIDLLEEDIKNGRSCSYDSCPIALAIKRITGIEPRVEYRYITVGNNRFCNPQEIMDAIDRYDTAREMIPFSFVLDNEPQMTKDQARKLVEDLLNE